jgi:hypothetical protein
MSAFWDRTQHKVGYPNQGSPCHSSFCSSYQSVTHGPNSGQVARYAMETRKARLKIPDGRRWIFKDIDIPTDQEIARLAERLHAARQAYRETIGEWEVIYSPSRPHNYVATTSSPRTQTVLEVRDVHSVFPSTFTIRWATRSSHSGESHSHGPTATTSRLIRPVMKRICSLRSMPPSGTSLSMT